MTADNPVDVTAQAVLAVLARTPPAEVAAHTGMDPEDLAHAVQLYQAAGHAALAQHTTRRWGQVQIHFPCHNTAEQTVATHLGPHLRRAEAAGLVSSWWFIRKPQWRVRYQPGDSTPNGAARTYLGRTLDQLRAEGTVAGWCEGIYEPETDAFGGVHAMAIAHDLFHHDSCHILGYLTQPEVLNGRRELTILLCNLLMRAAGQDWYERGDIWARVATHRLDDRRTPPERLSRLKPQLRRLMTADFGPNSDPVRHGRLRFASPWVEAFEQAGTALADLARDGRLTRGLRAVLAHHILFHWNRLGITAASQAILAVAAREVVFDP
jgi:thiopeptide-type bacteriocin biosynthesis protein